MANFLAKVKHIPSELAHDSGERGLVGLATDKAIRLGGSWGLGAAKGYYRERFQVRGVPGDLAIGGGALGLEVLSHLFFKGRGCRKLSQLSDTALGSYLNSMGTAWGHKKAGRTLYVLNAGAPAPKNLPAGMTVAGALDGQGGAYLSPREVLAYSRAR